MEAVKHHDAAVGMLIYTSKTKTASTPISGEQRQNILLDGESLEDVDKVPRLDVRRERPGHRGDQKHDFLACNPIFGTGMKYRYA